jgi:L-ribulose-5-phosphate 3-epimerase
MRRRKFLQTVAVAAVAGPIAGTVHAAPAPAKDLDRQIGVTTGSLMRNLSVDAQPGKLRLLDFPRIMRDELGMKVIDLMTATLASLEPAYVDQLRSAADKHGCVLTNLKMNQPELDLASPDEALRRRSLDEYKRTIDAAQRLGCRWVRPLPRSETPDRSRYVAAYRELIDYAGPKGISLLIENFGWMMAEPDAIPGIVAAVGPGLAACPDTGNWRDDVRYDGLAKAFPHAVTCDFKYKELDAEGRHAAYDLERCFRIGWDAGFRGPWCFEHFNADLPTLWKEFVLMKERLAQWMAGSLA